MKRRTQIIVAVCLALMMLSAGVVWAVAPLLISTSVQGAGSGGAVGTSASYRLETSMGGSVLVSSSSAAYELCSGFLCAPPGFSVSLPFINRGP